MLSRAKSFSRWRLLADPGFDRLSLKPSESLLAEIRRLRKVEAETLRRDAPLIDGILAELSALEKDMFCVVVDASAENSFTRARRQLTVVMTALQRLRNDGKDAVGQPCQSCNALEPVRDYRVATTGPGSRTPVWLCSFCAEMKQNGLAFEECSECGLLFQPYAGQEGVKASKRTRKTHESCPGSAKRKRTR